jgi:peptide/nickel transport system permease protein
MARYLIRRSLQSVLLFVVITALFFAVQRLAPGGPQAFLEDPRMTAADKQALVEAWGLHEPIHVQYVTWASHVLRGDFGRSFQDRRPVLDKIMERIPNSLYLNAASIALGFLGIPLGIWAAQHRGKLPDHLVRVFTVLMNAVPHWWLALMLLILLAATLRLVPLGGMHTIGRDTLLDRLWHLVLPATVGAMGAWVGYARFIRSEMLEVMGQDYIKTARAKGLAESQVRLGHALRNALIPVATGFGGIVAGLIGGSVLLERVFSWPGVGRLGYDAFVSRDYPVTMGILVIFTILIMAGNLLSDIAIAWLDPRVRFD